MTRLAFLYSAALSATEQLLSMSRCDWRPKGRVKCKISEGCYDTSEDSKRDYNKWEDNKWDYNEWEGNKRENNQWEDDEWEDKKWEDNEWDDN